MFACPDQEIHRFGLLFLCALTPQQDKYENENEASACIGWANGSEQTAHRVCVYKVHAQPVQSALYVVSLPTSQLSLPLRQFTRLSSRLLSLSPHMHAPPPPFLHAPAGSRNKSLRFARVGTEAVLFSMGDIHRSPRPFRLFAAQRTAQTRVQHPACQRLRAFATFLYVGFVPEGAFADAAVPGSSA
jgi:hypothetical protein